VFWKVDNKFKQIKYLDDTSNITSWYTRWENSLGAPHVVQITGQCATCQRERNSGNSIVRTCQWAVR